MSEWINREEQIPTQEKILCCYEDKIFICEWVESKWGHGYKTWDARYEKLDCTHWMPLPQPPGVKDEESRS